MVLVLWNEEEEFATIQIEAHSWPILFDDVKSSSKLFRTSNEGTIVQVPNIQC